MLNYFIPRPVYSTITTKVPNRMLNPDQVMRMWKRTMLNKLNTNLLNVSCMMVALDQYYLQLQTAHLQSECFYLWNTGLEWGLVPPPHPPYPHPKSVWKFCLKPDLSMFHLGIALSSEQNFQALFPLKLFSVFSGAKRRQSCMPVWKHWVTSVQRQSCPSDCQSYF